VRRHDLIRLLDEFSRARELRVGYATVGGVASSRGDHRRRPDEKASRWLLGMLAKRPRVPPERRPSVLPPTDSPSRPRTWHPSPRALPLHKPPAPRTEPQVGIGPEARPERKKPNHEG